MNSILRSSAALGILAAVCIGGCTGAYVTAQIFTDEATVAYAPSGVGQSAPVRSYPNYSCSATDCALSTVASSPPYPPMMLAIAKTITILSLSDDPVADGVTSATISEQ